MCTQDLSLHLCSCSDISSEKIKKLFSSELDQLKRKKESFLLIKWKLFKYIAYEWNGMDGMLFSPTDKLTSEVTVEYLCAEMNNRNCFDFAYSPTEGDNIVFEVEKIGKGGRPKIKQPRYLFNSLIFKDNQWTIDSYNPFYDKTEEIGKGVLKYKSTQISE